MVGLATLARCGEPRSSSLRAQPRLSWACTRFPDAPRPHAIGSPLDGPGSPPGPQNSPDGPSYAEVHRVRGTSPPPTQRLPERSQTRLIAAAIVPVHHQIDREPELVVGRSGSGRRKARPRARAAAREVAGVQPLLLSSRPERGRHLHPEPVVLGHPQEVLDPRSELRVQGADIRHTPALRSHAVRRRSLQKNAPDMS